MVELHSNFYILSRTRWHKFIHWLDGRKYPPIYIHYPSYTRPSCASIIKMKNIT